MIMDKMCLLLFLKVFFMGMIWLRLKREAKGSGTKITADKYSLADALFEGAKNVSLAEQLFSMAVMVSA